MRETIISADTLYRYTLWRDVGGIAINPGYVLFCSRNPSVADAERNDPTIRRKMDFTRRWGYGSMCVVNAFAYRATDPEEMYAARDPIGPENDRWIRAMAKDAALIVGSWGAGGGFLDRYKHLRSLLGGPIMCLGTTKDGQPRHPLYVKADTVLQPWHGGIA